jgi:hypothetical protein
MAATMMFSTTIRRDHVFCVSNSLHLTFDYHKYNANDRESLNYVVRVVVDLPAADRGKANSHWEKHPAK